MCIVWVYSNGSRLECEFVAFVCVEFCQAIYNYFGHWEERRTRQNAGALGRGKRSMILWRNAKHFEWRINIVYMQKYLYCFMQYPLYGTK